MSLELLERWSPLLAELGAVGVHLGEAIERDDVIGAIAADAQIRALRAAIARVEAPIQLRGVAAELAALREVTTLTVGARGAEAMQSRWLARPLPGDAALLATPLGVAVLADAVLPPVWDYDLDVVVLVGRALVPVAAILADLGQRRIVIVLDDAAAAGELAPPPRAVLATTPDEVAAAIRTMVPLAPTRAVIRCATTVDGDAGRAIADATNAAVSDLRIHRNTVLAFSRTWIGQGTANLPGLGRWPSIDALDEAFAGRPMVIVAPGPSLARNIDQLAQLKGRAIICAFSHSIRPVLAAGVTPDLVVTVDPQDVRYHFAGCDLSTTCLVNGATVHPSLFELPARRMLTLSANCAIDDWLFGALGVDATCPGGGSVATTALSLALRWKCDPVVFLGLDLSFPGGEYYVRTSVDGDARAEIDDRGVVKVLGWSDQFHAMKAQGGPAAPRERAVELPGWHGGTVPSSFMFSMFHRWFVERMTSVDVRVYNCTEGGAFIAGMEHRPLAEVVPLVRGELDVGAVLDAAIARHDAAGRAARLHHQLDTYARGLLRARSLARRARGLAVRLLVRPDDRATAARLTRIERHLAATLAPMAFVSLIAQREIDRAFDVATRTGSAAGTYLDASVALFDALLQVIDHLLPTLRAHPPRTENRDADAA